MNEKLIYVSPQMEVIRMEVEGVIAGSGNLPGVSDGGSAYSTSGSRSRATHSYNGASSSDIEDLINDILTIEQ